MNVFIVLSMFLVWSFASVQFAGSVMVSDACANQTSAVNAVVAPYLDEFEAGIVIYYADCKEGSVNPLITYIDRAQSNLTAMQSDIANVKDFLTLQGSEELGNNLTRDYDHTLISMNNTKVGLDCTEINKHWTDVTSDICDTFLNQWVDIYLSQALAIMFLSIARLLICTTEDEAAKKEAYERINEDYQRKSECEISIQPERNHVTSGQYGATRGPPQAQYNVPNYNVPAYQNHPPRPGYSNNQRYQFDRF